MTQVSLPAATVTWCVEEGHRTQAGFAGLPGHYRTSNSPLNHIIAKIGESAVEKWHR